MKRLAGVDEELQKLKECKMDDVAARRRAREAFKEIQYSIDHILFKVVICLCFLVFSFVSCRWNHGIDEINESFFFLVWFCY